MNAGPLLLPPPFSPSPWLPATARDAQVSLFLPSVDGMSERSSL